jgi:SAM-dependent methyltransferase
MLAQRSPCRARPLCESRRDSVGILSQMALHRAQADSKAARGTRTIAALEIQGRAHHVVKDRVEVLVQADLDFFDMNDAFPRAASGQCVVPYGRGQVLHPNLFALPEQASKLDHVPQLAHIAGPSVTLQGCHRCSGHLRRTYAVPGRQLRDELMNQRCDVGVSLSEGRHSQCDALNPIVEVRSKPSGLNLVFQGTQGGTHQARIHADLGAPADAHEFAIFEEAQELCLDVHRHFTDLVEKQRASGGRFHLPTRALVRAGERAAFVPEQLALEQRVRDRRAIDGHEGSRAARGQLVHAPGNHLLTRPAFADDRDPHVLTGYDTNDTVELAHRRGPHNWLEDDVILTYSTRHCPDTYHILSHRPLRPLRCPHRVPLPSRQSRSGGQTRRVVTARVAGTIAATRRQVRRLKRTGFAVAPVQLGQRAPRGWEDAGGGTAPEDASFDRQLPRRVRERSRQYWTPVAVAIRVAARFRNHGARSILDVGCGPGKFCIVAGSLDPRFAVHGIDQRPRLIRHGARLARKLGAYNVRFSVGDVTTIPWDAYQGLYFFNPFAENIFHAQDRFDDDVQLSALRFASELLRVERLLERARVGTVVVTYHGLGGPIPSSYELVSDERAGSDRVRTWVQRRRLDSRWVWLEVQNSVLRVRRSELHCALASLICECPLSDRAANPRPEEPDTCPDITASAHLG